MERSPISSRLIVLLSGVSLSCLLTENFRGEESTLLRGEGKISSCSGLSRLNLTLGKYLTVSFFLLLLTGETSTTTPWTQASSLISISDVSHSAGLSRLVDRHDWHNS